MTSLLTNSLTGLGLVLLTHAVYSAYEHSLLPSALPTPPTPTSTHTTHTPLPLDVVLETLLSTLMLTLAIVRSAPPLRPIRWREFAGKVEREGWEPTSAQRADDDTAGAGAGAGAGARGAGGEGRGGSGNPYKALEERRGFVDVRKQREEFADWVRKGAAAGQGVGK